MSERASKYHARKTTLDGVTFASAAEARRYAELRLLERAGQISRLTLQPRFVLVPAFHDATGGRQRAIVYVGDFAYHEPGNKRIVIEDVKGFRTAAYALKAKLFRWRFGETHELREVQA